MSYLTHQSWGAVGVGGLFPGARQHGLDLVPGEVAGVEVRTHDGSQESLVILELGGHRLLLGPGVGALLHGGEDARLLPLGYSAEPDSCNREEIEIVERAEKGKEKIKMQKIQVGPVLSA